MNSPFKYTDYVTNSHFIGRNNEVAHFCSLVREHKNILIYSPARTGKRSLIYNSLEKLKQEAYDYILIGMNLFNIRCIEAFMLHFTNTIFRNFASSPMEWTDMLRRYLPSAPYVIDSNAISPKFVYTTKELLTDEQISEFVNLPHKLSVEHNCHIVFYFEQFQDIILFSDPERIFKIFEREWKNHYNISYIVTGERKNAMDDIFETRKFFYNMMEKIEILPIDRKLFSDYIITGFLKAGKVINPEMAGEIYDTVEGDPWYTQHLAQICFDLTRGYMNDKTIETGLKNLINLHDFLFHNIAFNLSKHQLRFIKAVLEGVTKFSSADILAKYNLNSSANVNRLKEALTKKEIITFNKNKEIVFIDPLLKHWFIKHFFAK